MSIDKKILREIQRHNRINAYITEQAAGNIVPGLELPTDDAASTPPVAGATAPQAGGTPEKIDLATDTEVEKIGGETESTESGTEELDVTELVSSQKKIETKQEEYFDNLFAQLKTLEEKLGEMDGLVTTINNLETKFDKFRPKTPQEKLELRSLDSGPFNQKLSDFFQDKEPDMEKSGKNEYVLTTDDANNYSTNDVETSFNDYDDEDTNMM